MLPTLQGNAFVSLTAPRGVLAGGRDRSRLVYAGDFVSVFRCSCRCNINMVVYPPAHTSTHKPTINK